MKSIKLMLLGISVMLLGGIIMIDPSSNLDGIEFLIVLTGFIISLVGFSWKHNN